MSDNTTATVTTISPTPASVVAPSIVASVEAAVQADVSSAESTLIPRLKAFALYAVAALVGFVLGKVL
jgi:hypothetical protein